MSERERRREHDAMIGGAGRRRLLRPESANWFADEVGMDFPSVDAVVDRIREAFLGSDGRAAPFSAEILLTAREAFRGKRIPFQVPIHRTCTGCGGRGEVWMDRCVECSGSGSALAHHEVQLSVPPGVRHGARFRFSVTPASASPTLVEITIAIQ